MTPLSEGHQRVLERVGDYFLATKCEGWVEYWFWDVIHGRRPWLFWDEPDEGIRADLFILRDDAGVWPAWSLTRHVWEPVQVAVWANHVARYGVVGAQDRCTDYQKKVAGEKNQ